nr:hypothetical protein [Nitrosomonas nitrosa]
MTRQSTCMFGIDSIDDYLVFCSEAVAELEADQDNVLRAFTAILALNHIPDWLQYKLTDLQRTALGLGGSQAGSVKDHFEAVNGDLRRVRNIANGFKHLRPVHPTENVPGYGKGPYGIGPFGMPYLVIDFGEHLPREERWDVGLDLCKRTFDWWQETLKSIANGG